MRTCPPGTNGAWYSSVSAQHTLSGRNDGTVTAMVPPGRRTRTSSRMAPKSSSMCSSTSAAMMRSNVPSGKGSLVASPRAQPLRAAAGRSPAWLMALTMAATSLSSASS